VETYILLLCRTLAHGLECAFPTRLGLVCCTQNGAVLDQIINL